MQQKYQASMAAEQAPAATGSEPSPSSSSSYPEPGTLLMAQHAFHGAGPGELLRLPRATVVRILPPHMAVTSDGQAAPEADVSAAAAMGWVLVQVLTSEEIGHVPLSHLAPLGLSGAPSDVAARRRPPQPFTPLRSAPGVGTGGRILAPSSSSSSSASPYSAPSSGSTSSLETVLALYGSLPAQVRSDVKSTVLRVTADFSAQGPAELSVTAGEEVLLMPDQEGCPTGWSYVFLRRQEGQGSGDVSSSMASGAGYVPTGYLDFSHPQHTASLAQSAQAAGAETSSSAASEPLPPGLVPVGAMSFTFKHPSAGAAAAAAASGSVAADIATAAAVGSSPPGSSFASASALLLPGGSSSFASSSSLSSASSLPFSASLRSSLHPTSSFGSSLSGSGLGSSVRSALASSLTSAAAATGPFSASIAGRMHKYGALASGGNGVVGGGFLEAQRNSVYRRMTSLEEALTGAPLLSAPAYLGSSLSSGGSPSTSRAYEAAVRAQQQRVAAAERQSLLNELRRIDVTQTSAPYGRR